ncbi:hypothetical protein SAMD00019534_090890, partial [Acytostelium subglobosum LB1]|uniref:hypothetical protein n=1 Tax=Acytostelium subglobosum LB1 TaxID=1410327 RepID=UPI000644FA8E
TDLIMGDVVLIAQSYLSMESDNLRKMACHQCLQFHAYGGNTTTPSMIASSTSTSTPTSSSTTSTTSTTTTTAPTSLTLRCSGCNEVYWCDDMCMAAGNDIHQRYECAYFKRLRSYKGVRFNADSMTEIKMLLGLLGRYIDIKHGFSGATPPSTPTLSGGSSSSSSSSSMGTMVIDGTEYPITYSSIDDVFQLVENDINENTNKAASDLVDEITMFIKLLLKDVLLPMPRKGKKNMDEQQQLQHQNDMQKRQQIVDDVVPRIRSLACKVRCNQFGIWSKRDKCIGVSVTPAASYFNHSCCPNIVDIRGTTTVVFKALHNIAKGTPLCITYLDMDQPTQERQDYLKMFYYFDCRCIRCKDQTEEIDGWISRFYCQRFKCSGTYFIEDKHRDIAEESVQLTCSYCYTKISVHPDRMVSPETVNKY